MHEQINHWILIIVHGEPSWGSCLQGFGLKFFTRREYKFKNVNFPRPRPVTLIPSVVLSLVAGNLRNDWIDATKRPSFRIMTRELVGIHFQCTLQYCRGVFRALYINVNTSVVVIPPLENAQSEYSGDEGANNSETRVIHFRETTREDEKGLNGSNFLPLPSSSRRKLNVTVPDFTYAYK